MKGSVVALGTLCGRRVAARMVDGQLDDLLFDAPEDTQNDVPPGIGAIFRGIAQRPMKGQGGLTVRLPEGNGWLRGTKGIAPGQALLVQVSGQAEAGKAVPVTTRVLFKSRFAIVTPDAPGLNISRAIRDEARRASLNDLAKAAMLGCNFGLIVRSNAERADPVRADAALQPGHDAAFGPDRQQDDDLLAGVLALEAEHQVSRRYNRIDSGTNTARRPMIHAIDPITRSLTV